MQSGTYCHAGCQTTTCRLTTPSLVPSIQRAVEAPNLPKILDTLIVYRKSSVSHFFKKKYEFFVNFLNWGKIISEMFVL